MIVKHYPQVSHNTIINHYISSLHCGANSKTDGLIVMILPKLFRYQREGHHFNYLT